MPLWTSKRLCGAMAPLALSAQMITVDGDFDNGRVQVLSIDQARREIVTAIPADNHTQDARMRFWHMRISGLTPGEAVTIRHTPSVNMHYVYSYDRETWHRFPTAGVNPLVFAFAESTVFLAPNIPYPYQRSLDLAEEFAEHPHVTVSDLATSEQGRAVKLFRITDASVPDAEKRIVWIQGRLHVFESPSSLVPEGFLRWMASDDPAAAAFRRKAIGYAVPILDVDNVFHGLSGKDMPSDFNRVWHLEPGPWNAVNAARALLFSLRDLGGSFLGFVDSHNPYYTQGPQWYVGSTQAVWDRFSACFVESMAEAGLTNRHGMFVESFSGPNPVNDERARDFASLHLNTDGDLVSLTLESPHHRDADGTFMVERGYLEWGEALGRSFHKILTAPEVVTAWQASAQQGGTAWGNSGWTHGTYRVLLEGGHITQTGSRARLVLRGRSSGSYTVRNLSLARRDGNSLNVREESWTPVTFGGNDWSDSVVVPQGGRVLSDPFDFDLRPGGDLFLTFRAENSTVYLNPNRSVTTAWFQQGRDDTARRHWEDAPIDETRGFVYILEEILVTERPWDDADGNGLPDSWERHWFGEAGLDPQQSAGPGARTLRQSFLQGGDPRAAAQKLVLLDVSRNAGIASETTEHPWYGGRLRSYQLERTGTLAPGDEVEWQPHGGPRDATGDVIQWTELPAGFYRVSIRLK